MTRVYIDIVGDLFHVGHLNLIRTAKALGDYLIVGVHSDLDTAKYKRKPIIEESQRYEIIESCRYVDEIIENAPLLITEEFMKEHQIDLVVHGDDIRQAYEEQHRVPRQLGKMRYVSYTDGISTSDIINKIKNLGVLNEN